MNVRECRDTSDGNNITPRNPPKVKIGVQKTLAAKQADKSKEARIYKEAYVLNLSESDLIIFCF